MSHKTICTAIYAQLRGELRRQLIACLRQGRSTRLARSRGNDRRGQIPEMVSIHMRPPEVEDRVMPGHWEAGLIKGASNKSSVGVLVERSTRWCCWPRWKMPRRLRRWRAAQPSSTRVAAPMRQSFTYDQGREISQHRQLAINVGVHVYFCDPHSPWQRGTCENTYGLLRQYLPKGTDLSVHSQDDLDAIADSLNSRPRATHGFNTPLAVFAHLLAIAQQTPAAIQ